MIKVALAIANWLLGVVAKSTDASIERDRIAADVKVSELREHAAVVRTGMQNKWFWIPWLMATVPLSAWFGWGVLDTLCNGALPDVATLPPQLKEYADVAWANVFFAGSGVASATVIARAIAGRK